MLVLSFTIVSDHAILCSHLIKFLCSGTASISFIDKCLKKNSIRNEISYYQLDIIKMIYLLYMCQYVLQYQIIRGSQTYEWLFVQFSQQADREFIESYKVYQYNQYKQKYKNVRYSRSECPIGQMVVCNGR